MLGDWDAETGNAIRDAGRCRSQRRPAGVARGDRRVLGRSDVCRRPAPPQGAENGSALLLLSVSGGLTTPLLIWGMAGVIDTIPRLQGKAIDPWALTAPWLAALAAASLWSGLSQPAITYWTALVRERINAKLQLRFLEHAVALALATFERLDYYTKLNTAQSALGSPVVGLLGSLAGIASTLAALGGLLLLFARASPLLAVALLAAGGIYAALYQTQAEWYR